MVRLLSEGHFSRPRENPFAPEIDHGQSEDADEDHEFPENGPSRATGVERGHREEVKNVHVEGQEEQGVKVVVDAETHAGGTMRGDAAFVGQPEVTGPALGRQQSGPDERHGPQKRPGRQEHNDRQIEPAEIHRYVRFDCVDDKKSCYAATKQLNIEKFDRILSAASRKMTADMIQEAGK